MVSRQGKRRSKPPSRERYEKSHPTVSIRMDREFKDAFDLLKDKSGLSGADVLKVGMERCAPLVGNAYDKGFWTGMAEVQLVVWEDCEDEIHVICSNFLYKDSEPNTDIQ